MTKRISVTASHLIASRSRFGCSQAISLGVIVNVYGPPGVVSWTCFGRFRTAMKMPPTTIRQAIAHHVVELVVIRRLVDRTTALTRAGPMTPDMQKDRTPGVECSAIVSSPIYHNFRFSFGKMPGSSPLVNANLDTAAEAETNAHGPTLPEILNRVGLPSGELCKLLGIFSSAQLCAGCRGPSRIYLWNVP